MDSDNLEAAKVLLPVEYTHPVNNVLMNILVYRMIDLTYKKLMSF